MGGKGCALWQLAPESVMAYFCWQLHDELAYLGCDI